MSAETDDTKDQQQAEPSPQHGRDWEEVYAFEQMWSGNPNVALVNAFAGPLGQLPAAAALDVGCGEGADAVFLAQRGWDVTALDPASGALARGQAAEKAASEDQQAAHPVTWLHGGLLDDGVAGELGAATFDVVTVFYPALSREGEADVRVQKRLRQLVKRGGTLLAVGHANVDPQVAREHGYDPALLVSVEEIADFLAASGWDVSRETAQRDVTEGAGAHHHEDVVVIARRPEEK